MFNLRKMLALPVKKPGAPTRVVVSSAESVLKHLQTVTIYHFASHLTEIQPVSLDVYELAVQCTNAEILDALGERNPLEPWMLAHLMYMQPDGREGPLNVNGKTFVFTVLGVPAMTNYNWSKHQWVVRDQRSHDLLRLEGPDVKWGHGWPGPRVLAMSAILSTEDKNMEAICCETKCIEVGSGSVPKILSQESYPNYKEILAPLC